MRCLDERELRVLESRFGLGGGSPSTLKQVGKDMGLTKEWIRVIEQRAIRKLGSARRRSRRFLGYGRGPSLRCMGRLMDRLSDPRIERSPWTGCLGEHSSGILVIDAWLVGQNARAEGAEKLICRSGRAWCLADSYRDCFISKRL